MKTTFWGPPGWVFLHSMAHNYPEKPSTFDKVNTKLFYSQCEHMLPCKYCRSSYNQYIKELPIDNFLESRETLAYWLYLIHNKVNEKLRTQGYNVSDNPSFVEICAKYESVRAGCGKSPGKGPSCRLPIKQRQIEYNMKRFQQIVRKYTAK